MEHYDDEPIVAGAYYDRRGQRIGISRWMSLQAHEDYQRVAINEIGEYVVSTVWMGLDYSFGIGEKQVFETMVFTADDWYGRAESAALEVRRYPNEDAAIRGHESMVTLLMATALLHD